MANTNEEDGELCGNRKLGDIGVVVKDVVVFNASPNSPFSFRLSGTFQWFLAFQQVYKTRQVIKYKKDDKSCTVILIRLK